MLHSSTSMPSTSLGVFRCDHRRTNDVIDASSFNSNSWCGPCKTLSPILEKLARDADIRTGSGLPIDLITVDTDEHGVLAQRYNVRATFSLSAQKSS